MQPRRIGLVLSYSLAHCRGILRGIKRFAETRPEWIITPVEPDGRGIRLLKELRPVGVIGHLFDRRLAARVQALRCPVINVAGVFDDFSISSVGLENDQIGRLAAEHFIQRRFQLFAFVGHPNHAYSNARQRGFEAAVQRSGFKVFYYHEKGLFDPRGQLWSLDVRFRRWLTRLPNPVAVFACNDVWGLQVAEACRATGLSIPEKVAVLGVDNDDLLCEVSRPSLSSIAVPSEAIGMQAATLLHQTMRRTISTRNVAAPKRILLPPIGVVVRRSTDVLAIDDPHVAEALRRISSEPLRLTSAHQLASGLDMSRRSLERRFRHKLGRSIGEEIRRVHLDRARQLLATTDLSISQVALRSGFSDGRHLAVVFRRDLQTTPTDFRRLHSVG